MASFKLLLTLLLMCPTNWALSMTSSDSLSVSSKSPLSNLNTKEPSTPATSAAATLGDLYRKSRQSRCIRCYDDRYGDDYERSRYSTGSGGAGGRGAIPSGGYPSYPTRIYDERPGGNWYYPRETNDRYDESRVGYGSSGGGGVRENDRYYYPYNGNYYERNEDRYNTRTYDRYERDRYDSRYSHERSPSETRGYGHGGYESRDRFPTDRYPTDRYPNDRDRGNDFYRGGDRYPDRNRGSSGGGIYDRYGQDDRYLSRYDYRNYRPWDETYRGQSGFDNSGRGYYFANERPNDYYEPPPQPPPQYGHQYRPLGPSGPGPSTPGPTYLPRDPHEQSRPSNSHHGYPDDRLGSSSSSSPSSSSSASSGSDYGNRPRDDVHGGGHGSGSDGGGRGGSESSGGATGGGSGDNKNGYTGGSWSYVNDREKDASYKGGIRDKDNQSSPYGGGRGGRPSLSGSYLLDRDNNVPETSVAINPDKPGSDSQISNSPMASKLTSSPSSSSSSTSKLTEDRSVTESKDSN